MVKALHRHESRTKNKGQDGFEKDFFKLMNNSVFGKTMKKVREKIETTDKRKSHLVSDPNYYTIK